MKILHLIYSLEVGGAEVDLVAKSRQLAQAHGCDVTIACLLARGELAVQAEAAGIRVLGPLMRGRCDILIVPRLVWLMRRERYDVVHTHMFASNLLGRLAATLAGVPGIFATVQLIADREAWWQILIDRLLQYKTATMIASSQAVRHSFIRRGIHPAKIKVIYNCVDLSRFETVDQAAARQTMRRAFGWNKDCFVVGAVARLEQVKGLAILIQAAEAVVAALPQARFLVVGDGPQRETLLAQVRRLGLEGRVILAGRRGDVPQVLPALDLFVLPSLSEALGIAAIEALASGLPVVASRVGGLPEVIVHGETGWLTPPGDAARLAEAILHVAAHPVEAGQRAEQGQARVRDQFDVASLAAAQLELYRDCQREQEK